MRIRRSTAIDLGFIQALAKGEVYSRGAHLYFSDDKIINPPVFAVLESYGPEVSAGHFFVAVDGVGHILGFVHFTRGSTRIEELCVSGLHEGQGIGRALVRACLLDARSAGCMQIHANALRDTSEFFERLGFAGEQSTRQLLKDGTAIERIGMSRLVEHPFVQETIEALSESVRFFGTGEDNKWMRERIVVEIFLRGLDLEFADGELLPASNPPDAEFRGAHFEVKEMYPPDRKRHSEYKELLAKARVAFWPEELMSSYIPQEISLSDLVQQVIAVANEHAKHYEASARAAFDLLIYANQIHVERIAPDFVPNLEQLKMQGWRSVSFCRGHSTSYVLVTTDAAPDWIRNAARQLSFGRRDEA